MSVDNLFKTIERRTEQDLYRMTFRMAMTTQQDLAKQIAANQKTMKRQRIAAEVLWFFGSALIGLLLGYILDEALTAAAPDLRKELVTFWFKKDIYVFYFLAILCFAGVYLARITIWALKLL